MPFSPLSQSLSRIPGAAKNVRASDRPSDRPSIRPSVRPTVRPSVRPSVRPTARPTFLSRAAARRTPAQKKNEKKRSPYSKLFLPRVVAGRGHVCLLHEFSRAETWLTVLPPATKISERSELVAGGGRNFLLFFGYLRAPCTKSEH